MSAARSLDDFTFAFQPIVDIDSGAVYAYEALIRGRGGEPAGAVFAGPRRASGWRLTISAPAMRA
jgi:EAL domain-containing protein (putative c-di-GMP-specific phosphodiesterase class I)